MGPAQTCRGGSISELRVGVTVELTQGGRSPTSRHPAVELWEGHAVKSTAGCRPRVGGLSASLALSGPCRSAGPPISSWHLVIHIGTSLSLLAAQIFLLLRVRASGLLTICTLCDAAASCGNLDRIPGPGCGGAVQDGDALGPGGGSRKRQAHQVGETLHGKGTER